MHTHTRTRLHIACAVFGGLDCGDLQGISEDDLALLSEYDVDELLGADLDLDTLLSGAAGAAGAAIARLPERLQGVLRAALARGKPAAVAGGGGRWARLAGCARQRGVRAVPCHVMSCRGLERHGRHGYILARRCS